MIIFAYFLNKLFVNKCVNKYLSNISIEISSNKFLFQQFS